MKVFSSCPPCLIVGLVFEQSSRHGYDELQKGYLAWRMTWHTFKVNANPKPLESAKPILRSNFLISLPKLNMWGDITNDYALLFYGCLTKKDLMNLYNLEDQAIKSLISHRLDWRKEIDIIQDFAGLKLSAISKESISELRDIIHTVNADLMRLVTAELELPETPEIWMEMNRRTLYYCAKQNFKSLRQAFCDKYRRDTDQHCGRETMGHAV
jgi:succinate dehydrogenase flavin-adding protein (antitoxin of CptAB toxin-antitoxin module)